MKKIDSLELASVHKYFESAAEQARQATCLRARCGAVIVSKVGVIIGSGYNAPPLNDESQRTCKSDLDLNIKPKYDKTCCVHAEWNAVINGLSTNANEIPGSRLYFMRVDDKGDYTDASEPYCTTCSRFTMQAGVARFALWNSNGAYIYTLPEYNQRSYEYYERQI